MALRAVPTAEILARSEEERENEHNRWLDRKLYSKTPLTSFMYCREKFRQRYVLRADDYWGPDLVEGIAGHKVLEMHHARLLENTRLYPDEMREILFAEMNRLKHRIDSSRPLDFDEAANRILPLCHLYMENWQLWLSGVAGVEEVFGEEGDVQFGGVSIAGHLDLRTHEVMVVDFKFVNPQSGYRSPTPFDVGMEMYKSGVGAKRTAFLPLVKGLKNPPRSRKADQVWATSATGVALIEGLSPIGHSRSTKQTAEILVNHMATEIEKGNVDGGPPDIGKMLCQPRFCSYFGRCRFTKHLSRTSFK